MSKRLIDANELISAMYYYEHNEGGLTAYDAQDIINKAPTIEPKCGEWIELGELDGGYWKCSACGTPTEAYSAFKIYAYCPFCGARMEDVKLLPHIKRLKGADDE